MKNDIFKPFNQNNFSKLVNATKPLWSYPEWEDSFRNFYTEIIIRNSYFDNDIAYQMVSQKEKELLSVIFFQKKSEECSMNQVILTVIFMHQIPSTNILSEICFRMAQERYFLLMLATASLLGN